MNYGPWWQGSNQPQQQQPMMQNPQNNMGWQNQNPGYSQPMKSVSATIPGHPINNINEIVPNDVPMNGQVALFPSADYSYIVAKSWNQYGTIDTIKYVPDIQNAGLNQALPVGNQQMQQPEPQVVSVQQVIPDEMQKDICDRLDRMEQMMSKMFGAMEMPQMKPNQPKNKKEDG